MLVLIDFAVSLVAVACCFGLLGCLTCCARLFAARLKHGSRREAGAHNDENEPESLASLFTFVGRGYVFALLLAKALHHLGGALASCAGAASLPFIWPTVSARSDLLPGDVLDVATLCVLLPCLCAPFLALNGVGAMWLVYLGLAFSWMKLTTRGAVALTSGFALLISMYAFALFTGLFLPLREFRIVDTFLVGAGIVVLRLSPRNVGIGMAVAAVVVVPPPAIQALPTRVPQSMG